MYYHETVRVPAERVGVIVGRNGRVKRRVEELTNAKIEVSSEGVVTITSPEETEDPVLAWKARDMIRAIARGFSPNRALTLIDED
ncbi:MAG: KH domain-containing protein, partial [Candidatus Thorarchaeota archaeon]